MWVFGLFVAVPIIEIALFLQLGGIIGFWATLGLVILSAAMGSWLLRSQGKAAMGRLRHSIERMDDPTEPIASGAMIMLSGALLLTPGFFTDVVGLALLVPQIRKMVFDRLRASVQFSRFEMRGGANSKKTHEEPHDVIDGEYTDLSPDYSLDKIKRKH